MENALLLVMSVIAGASTTLTVLLIFAYRRTGQQVSKWQNAALTSISQISEMGELMRATPILTSEDVEDPTAFSQRQQLWISAVEMRAAGFIQELQDMSRGDTND